MKRLLASLMLSISLASASLAASESYTTEVITQPDQKWKFQRLRVQNIDETTKVFGRMTSSLFARAALPRGHVDVAAYMPNGTLISETTTDYTPAMLTRNVKKGGGVQFYATFDSILPSSTIIKIAFHEEPFVKVKPAHKENIAR